MKLSSQLEVLKRIRKDMPPRTRIERPLLGRGYRRRQRMHKAYEID
jgi:hypothetical protein